jgi:hypothetical protein
MSFAISLSPPTIIILRLICIHLQFFCHVFLFFYFLFPRRLKQPYNYGNPHNCLWYSHNQKNHSPHLFTNCIMQIETTFPFFLPLTICIEISIKWKQGKKGNKTIQRKQNLAKNYDKKRKSSHYSCQPIRWLAKVKVSFDHEFLNSNSLFAFGL